MQSWFFLLPAFLATAVLPFLSCIANHPSHAELKLLNASYDPTRELYQDVNAAFIKTWEKKSGQKIVINSSHGGSGKQARAILDGLPADVATLGLAWDIEALAKGGLVDPGWQTRLPDHSTPYTSTIVLVVRKGNPRGIRDWDDLAKPGTVVVTPNPKTSGGARWNYLAIWAWASEKFGGDETRIREFVSRLFKNVPVLDSGARGSTTTFGQRGIGQVLIAWENEAWLLKAELGKDQLEIVYPSVSILAEPPVTVVDSYARKHGTAEVAKAYLEFLYTEEGQEMAAKHHFRPRSEAVAARHKDQFPAMRLVTVDGNFGGWQKAQAAHFSDGGTFDQIFRPGQSGKVGQSGK